MSIINKNWMLTLLVTVLMGAGGCASQAPGTQPDDMSASEHKRHAEKHEQKSQKHQDKYDPKARSSYEKAPLDPTTDIYIIETYNPTERHKSHAKQHQRHADQHQQAAQKLLSYEEKHCAKFPETTRSTCPLMGQIKAVEDIEGGVRITFEDDVPRQAAIEHMQCHFAFARTEGFEGMNACPLYLEGVSVEAQGDGQSVTFTTNKPENIEALRARSRAHLSE